MTLRLLMFFAPLARLAVTIIGNISGVSPTATAIPKSKASNQSPFVKPLTRKISGTITIMKRISSQLTLFTPLSRLVSARFPVIAFPIEPK
ncbi:hypothetical protein D3C86_1781160 [compost metagenome]